MKLKLLLVATLFAFAFSLNACPDNTLSHQYETGALQWQVVRKEIDPNTLIHQAILENVSEEIINFLLSHGVNVDYPDENGMSPLTMAVLNRSTNAVKLLLDKGANPNPAVKWNNMTLLELALAMRDPDSVNVLVQKGACLTLKNKEGKGVLTTAISLAGPSSVQNERIKWIGVAKNMIQLGADVHSCDIYDSPLLSALHIVVFGADTSLLELFISKGVNLNMILKDGNRDSNTPLLYAISTGNLWLVKYLVESGADINKKINLGGITLTPLNQAVTRQLPEIIQYLLQHGARA